jgi:hypothetical protein
MATETCQVKIDKDTKDKIQALAIEEDRSINKMIKVMYQEYMDAKSSHEK